MLLKYTFSRNQCELSYENINEVILLPGKSYKTQKLRLENPALY